MTAITTASIPVIANRQATWEEYLYRVEHPQSELECVFLTVEQCGLKRWVTKVSTIHDLTSYLQ